MQTSGAPVLCTFLRCVLRPHALVKPASQSGQNSAFESCSARTCATYSCRSPEKVLCTRHAYTRVTYR